MIDLLYSMTIVDSALIPFAVSAGLLIFSPSRKRPVPANLALFTGFMIGFLLIRTFPIWPPIGGIGYVPYAMLAAGALGILADRPRFRVYACTGFAVGLPVAVAFLVSTEEFGLQLVRRFGYLTPLLMLFGLMFSIRLVAMGPVPAAGRSLLYASFALCGVAFAYGSAIGLHALSLAAAVLGGLIGLAHLRLTWPLSASFTVGGAYFTMAFSMAFSRDLLVFPVALTFLAFMAPFVAWHILPGRRKARFVVELICGIAVIIGAPISLLFGP